MLQRSTREVPVSGGKSERNGGARPTLCLTWEIDAQSGRPVGRWIVEGVEPTALSLASAA